MAGFDVSGSGGGSGSGAAAEPTVVQGGNLGAAETVNMSGETYVHYHGTLDANCAITVTNLTEGDRIDFFFTQDGTGGRTVTIDDGGGAVSCAVGSAAASVTKVECTYNGTDLLFEAPGSSDTVTTVRKSANETVNNSAALQNDDHLVLAVAANETWQFEGNLFITSPSTTSDFKCGWTVPAATTMLWAAVSNSGATWLAQAAASSPGAMLTEAQAPAIGGAALTWAVFVKGIIRVAATAGSVQFQWAQNTATAENTVLLEDSHIIFRRIATS